MSGTEERFIPQIGEIIDRYGPETGGFVSPAINKKSYPYEKRSLPFIEDESSYHQYEVIGDFSQIGKCIEDYYKKTKDEELYDRVQKVLAKTETGNYSELCPKRGEIAAVEGWGEGGGIQYQLFISVADLQKLGLIKEI